jgi:two-component sensor histidine kinase
MVPVGGDEPVAALGAYWAEQRQPRPDEMERLQVIADAAALALANYLSPVAGAQRGHDSDTSAPKRKMQREHETPSIAFKRGLLRALISRVRNIGLRPNSLETYAFAVLCVLVATLVREGFRASGASALNIYSAYYPAVLLAMLVGGRRCGVLAAVLGGLAAYYFFMPPLYQFVPLTLSDFLNLTLYFGASSLIILIIGRYQRAILRLGQEDARHLTLAREQNHRLRNAITVAEAVVRQSLRDQPERGQMIARRIRAGLAEVELEDADARPFGLRDLLTAELEPYDLARFELEGEDAAQLSPKTRNILSLVIHELATNALKYGALSVPDGRVAVTWGRHQGGTKIVWLEAGGPLVKPPQKRGYGSILLQRIVQGAGGSCTVDFRPTGVAAEISLAVA